MKFKEWIIILKIRRVFTALFNSLPLCDGLCSVGYLEPTVDPLWHDKWPLNAKRQICMRLCVALDWAQASWASSREWVWSGGQNELCFGHEFAL